MWKADGLDEDPSGVPCHCHFHRNVRIVAVDVHEQVADSLLWLRFGYWNDLAFDGLVASFESSFISAAIPT